MKKHFESIHNGNYEETRLDEKISYDQHHRRIKEDIYNMSDDGLLTIKSEELNEYFNIMENEDILIRNEGDFDNSDQNSNNIKNINEVCDKFNIIFLKT